MSTLSLTHRSNKKETEEMLFTQTGMWITVAQGGHKDFLML